MKKLAFIFCMMLLSVFLIATDAVAQQAQQQQRAPGRCYNDTPCTCRNHTPPGGIAGFCRTCSVTDDASPANTYEMTVCSSIPAAQKDALACKRAIQRCNGQQITCGPSTPGGPVIAGTAGSADAFSASSGSTEQCTLVESTPSSGSFEFNGVEYK